MKNRLVHRLVHRLVQWILRYSSVLVRLAPGSYLPLGCLRQIGIMGTSGRTKCVVGEFRKLSGQRTVAESVLA